MMIAAPLVNNLVEERNYYKNYNINMDGKINQYWSQLATARVEQAGELLNPLAELSSINRKHCAYTALLAGIGIFWLGSFLKNYV